MDLPLEPLAICSALVVARKSCSRDRTKLWALSPRGFNTNDSKNPPRLVYVPSALGILFCFFLPLFPLHIPYSLRIFNFFIWTSFGLFLTKKAVQAARRKSPKFDVLWFLPNLFWESFLIWYFGVWSRFCYCFSCFFLFNSWRKSKSHFKNSK